MRGGHITDDVWVDLMAGVADANHREHVRQCTSCRETLDEVREGWDLARDADVPEPSPLYWESFRRGVGQKIADEAAPVSRGGVLSLRWAVAMAAMVVLSLSIFSLSHRTSTAPPRPGVVVLPAWSALPPAEADAGLSILASLDASDLAHASCRDVALCLADVSDEEGDRIAEALRHELKGRPL
jgi:hypothetical protein